MTTSPPEREEPAASPRFALRPEVEADAPFRLALFRASRGPGWEQIPLPPDMLTRIMDQQFHAQTQGHRTAYPDARLQIVTIDALPVGRLATYQGTHALHLIDIAMIPERRGQGIGGTILRTLKDQAAAAGTPVILQVARDNPAAQRLYHRQGFVMTAANDTHLTLRWPAPPPTSAGTA
ncbi:GNAT family N-acetyltransferase [Caulobacter sp.]|uniref:GNAT family N-acetyltransferase n=1 Tax=Caulobacter sp. TaxID=78 RepID=UPI003BAF009E